MIMSRYRHSWISPPPPNRGHLILCGEVTFRLHQACYDSGDKEHSVCFSPERSQTMAKGNGRRILEKYRNQIPTFNDDMQGTGAITLAAISTALRILNADLRHQRVVIFGSGTAGIGNADQIRAAMMLAGLSKEEATKHFWCVDIQGLLLDTMGDALRDFQVPYARSASEVQSWKHDMPQGGISLAEVVRQVHPTMLIGTSTAPGTFTEAIVKDMAAHTQRPIIFPLSNPTQLMEASSSDLITWTDGRARVATGIPSHPVTYRGTTYGIGQANNPLRYPGLARGTTGAH